VKLCTMVERVLLLPTSKFVWWLYQDVTLKIIRSGGSAVQTWSILSTGGLELIQSIPFTMSKPGPDPERQEAPHPHQVVVDPTDSYIVVPDLGADLIRVFSIDHSTSALKESTSFSTPPGSGPRHGAFLATASETYFFLHSELSNTVVSYKVSYGTKSLSFNEVFSSGTFGSEPTPDGAAAAETLLSVWPLLPPVYLSNPTNYHQSLMANTS
jgi:hypothetical protein